MEEELQDKINKFNSLCGDWNYRDIVDVTIPHLAGISFNRDLQQIDIMYEQYSNLLDDYVYCPCGYTTNPQIIQKLKDLDIDSKEDVLFFMYDIEELINQEEVEILLASKEDQELKEYKVSLQELDYGV